MSLKRILGAMVIPCLVVLSGCEKTGDVTAPEVGSVFTQIIHYHPSFLEKHPDQTATGSLFSQVVFRVSDPDGLDDLNTLSVEDTNNSLSYELVNRLPQESIGAHYENATNLFVDVFEAQGLDRIDLQGWQVKAKDLQGYSTTRDFEYALFDSALASTEQFVYSPDYSGLDTADGVMAMEAMTIADNAISVVRDSADQLTISFEVLDNRASNYAIWFYDQSDLLALPSNVIRLDEAAKGELDASSAAIQSNPIVFGQTTSLTVNLSEIKLDNNALASSLDGMHIVLYDLEDTSFIVSNRAWFSQAGISEFVPITP